MRLLALALLLVLIPSVASADCIASSLNILATVQAADVITTSGPQVRGFPGGFLAQNNKAGCGLAGALPCQYIEGDPLAARSGCVKSLATDAACAAGINLALRETEYLALHHGTEAARKNVCFLNYIGAFFYAVIVIPNNLRADYDIQKRGAFIRNPSSLQFALHRWTF